MNVIIENEKPGRNQDPPDFKSLAGNMEGSRLVDCVLTAVNSVENGEIHPVVAADRGMTFRPKIMLALLSFCYARGIYCSQDVATNLRNDAFYQILCNNDCPDWRVIRRFRRGNLLALHHCLENVYCEVATRQVQAPEKSRMNGHLLAAPGLGSAANSRALPLNRVAEAVDDSLDRAIWLDDMMDNED